MRMETEELEVAEGVREEIRPWHFVLPCEDRKAKEDYYQSMDPDDYSD